MTGPLSALLVNPSPAHDCWEDRVNGALGKGGGVGDVRDSRPESRVSDWPQYALRAGLGGRIIRRFAPG